MQIISGTRKFTVAARAPWPQVFLLCLVLARPAISQVIDEGVFAVRRGSDVIAREEFQLMATSSGFQVTSAVSYPPRRTRIVLNSTLSLGRDSLPVAFESQLQRGGSRVLAQFDPTRVVFRIETEHGESAREYPAAARSMVVSDSVFAFYALLPGTRPGSVRLTWPREDRRVDFELSTRDGGTVTVDGRNLHTRVVVLSAGEDRRECWFDDNNRLVRVEIPNAGIVVERMWDGSIR